MAEVAGKKIKELELVTTVSGKDDLLIDTTPDTGSPQTKRISVGKFKEEMNRELNSALGGMTLLTGQTTITPVPNEQTSKHVTFKTPFKSKPEVFITPRSSVAGKVLLGVGVIGTTTNGFDIYVLRTNDTDTEISWLAIGKM